MSWSKFWGTIPRLVSATLRNVAPLRDYIPIRFRAVSMFGRSPFTGGRGGKEYTDVQIHLDNAIALRIADLYEIVAAMNTLLSKKKLPRHMRVKYVDFDELVRPLILGPSSWETLLKQGRALAVQRDKAFGSAYRLYLPTVLAKILSAKGKEAALSDLIATETKAIDLIGRGFMAAQAHASGFREILKQLWRKGGLGRRPDDQTTSRRMIDEVPGFAIHDMVGLSYASTVNASLIWNEYFGDTAKVGYFFVHEFAAFAGRLARGEPAELSCELAQYIRAERHYPGPLDAARAATYANIVPAYDAFDDIWHDVATVYGGSQAFAAEVSRCIRSGAPRTLRIRALVA